MQLELNLKKLEARKKELEAELVKLDSFIALARDYKQYATVVEEKVEPVQLPLPMPQPEPQLLVQANNGKTRKHYNQGARRAVLLCLHTGPTTEQELSRYLSWDTYKTRITLTSMFQLRLCYLSEHGQVVLSEEGKKQVAWFQSHPGRVTYTPNRRYFDKAHVGG